MDPWIYWLIAALILGVIEVIGGGTLVFGLLGVGALGGALTAALTDNLFAPWLVFAVVSAAMLVFVRPVAKRHMRVTAASRSGISTLVGLLAVVTEPVDGHDGRVEINGDLWSARSFDGETEFATGEEVHVMQIEGATALVA